MRLFVGFLFAFLVATCITGDCFGLVDSNTSFFRIDEIPAAALGTHQSYYDIQTGDFIVAIGPEVFIFGIDFSAGNNADAFDRSGLNESSALGPALQNDPGGIGWLSLPPPFGPGLEEGIHNLGPILEPYPLGVVEGETELEFDLAAQLLYGTYAPSLISASGDASGEAVFKDVFVVRPTFPVSSIPEPSVAVFVRLVAVGCLMRRRRV